MPLQLWLAFVAASIVVLIVPGPTILALTSYALAYGRRVHGPLIAAVALGDSTAVSVSLLGVEALRAASTFWFDVVRWAGGFYVIWLGVKLFRDRPTKSAPSVAARSRWRVFANMYGVTALNPKGVIFYVGFLPQFVDPAIDGSGQLFVLGATFVALATANATLYAAGASFLRRRLLSGAGQRPFTITVGALLVCVGVWLLFSGK